MSNLAKSAAVACLGFGLASCPSAALDTRLAAPEVAPLVYRVADRLDEWGQPEGVAQSARDAFAPGVEWITVPAAQAVGRPLVDLHDAYLNGLPEPLPDAALYFSETDALRYTLQISD